MDRLRVPMKGKSTWLKEDDVNISSTTLTHRVARRFSMDVDEQVLAQIGARALESAVDALGRHVAYEHEGDIRQAVDKFLFDGTWVKPILEQEIRRAAREFVLALWSDEEKKDLRDWFDVFTAKCQGA